MTSLSRVEIDLGALRHNFAVVRERSGSEVLAVVKADAYGHGAVAVARALMKEEGLAGMVVARIDEAVELREQDIGSRLLLLGSGLAALDPPARREIVTLVGEHQVEVVVGSLDELRALAAAVGEEKRAVAVHLKIDTGMSRAGLAPEELATAREQLKAAERLRWVGLLSHLAESERLDARGVEDRGSGPADEDFTALQRERFERVVATLDEGERSGLEIHLANSAAALYRSGLRRRLVRAGGALYGLDLATGAAGDRRAELRPVMTVRSAIVQLREIEPGTGVGYRRTWTAQRRSQIALVQIGYADGYPTRAAGARALTERGAAPVVGAVSMDLICLDVSGLGVGVGDEVVLLGELGNQRLSAADLAEWSGAALYEVTCRFSRRLPRVLLGS